MGADNSEKGQGNRWVSSNYETLIPLIWSQEENFFEYIFVIPYGYDLRNY